MPVQEKIKEERSEVASSYRSTFLVLKGGGFLIVAIIVLRKHPVKYAGATALATARSLGHDIPG